MQEMQARGRCEVLRVGVLSPRDSQIGLRDPAGWRDEAIRRKQSRMVDWRGSIAPDENATSLLASRVLMLIARLVLGSTVIMAMLVPVFVVGTSLGNPFDRRMRMMPAAPDKRVCQQDASGDQHKGSIHG